MNSLFAKGIVIIGISIAGIALIPAALGFGTAGIVGVSIAAGIQSCIGNVAAGSLFSFFQSLGMNRIFYMCGYKSCCYYDINNRRFICT